MAETDDDKQFFVTSIYGAKTNLPLVDLQLGGIHMQVSPDKARKIALMILEAADASESDGFIVNWLRDKLGQSTEVAGLIMHEFRGYRDANRQRYRDFDGGDL